MAVSSAAFQRSRRRPPQGQEDVADDVDVAEHVERPGQRRRRHGRQRLGQRQRPERGGVDLECEDEVRGKTATGPSPHERDQPRRRTARAGTSRAASRQTARRRSPPASRPRWRTRTSGRSRDLARSPVNVSARRSGSPTTARTPNIATLATGTSQRRQPGHAAAGEVLAGEESWGEEQAAEGARDAAVDVEEFLCELLREVPHRRVERLDRLSAARAERAVQRRGAVGARLDWSDDRQCRSSIETGAELGEAGQRHRQASADLRPPRDERAHRGSFGAIVEIVGEQDRRHLRHARPRRRGCP